MNSSYRGVARRGGACLQRISLTLGNEMSRSRCFPKPNKDDSDCSEPGMTSVQLVNIEVSRAANV
jgi:hypothetical protein